MNRSPRTRWTGFRKNLGALALAALALAACGDDSDTSGVPGASGAGGTSAGAAGKSAGGNGGSSTAGGSGGSAQAGSAQAGKGGSGQSGSGGSEAGGSSQAGSGGSPQAGQGGSSQAGSAQAGSGSGGSAQAGSGGSSQAGSGGSPSAGSGGSGGSGGAGGSAQAGSGGSSPGADGWQKAFAKDGVGVSCASTYEQTASSSAPRLKFGSTEIFVGFQQFGDNQDPVFRRFDDGKEVYCEHHEKQPPDGRALGITWNGGDKAYVVYTIVGGGTDLEAKAKGSWIGNYGDGGGSSKVAVLGEVEVKFGTLQRAVFIPAKKSNGTKTNTLYPVDAVTVLANGTLEFKGSSAYSPLNPDRTPMCVGSVDYPAPIDPNNKESPSFLGRFSADMTTLQCGSTGGCSQVKSPCP